MNKVIELHSVKYSSGEMVSKSIESQMKTILEGNSNYKFTGLTYHPTEHPNLVKASLIVKERNPKHDLIKTIKREYYHMKERGWDRIFLFFDLHGTVIKPNFQEGNVELDYYPYAKETLQLISDRDDLDLNIYTCSHEHEIIEYQRLFKLDGINFKYVNENPDVPTNGYGNYDTKPYMNVLFEDKAGFFGETDWKPIYKFFKKRYGTTR